MKKLLSLIFALCATVAVFAFAGCNNEGGTGGDEKTLPEIQDGYSISYVFTVKGDKLNITDTTSVYDYMQALSNEGLLTFEGNNGDYGFYITSVLGIKENTQSTANGYKGNAWSLYTTITEIDGVHYSSSYTAFDYNGITLYQASYGVSGVPCVEGETYALVYEYSAFTW